MDSLVVSKVMSGIPSQNRAYSLQQGMEMGDRCQALILDARLHHHIPDEVWTLTKLKVLSAENIPCHTLPNDLQVLEQLEVLNLLGCGTTAIPKTIKNIPLKALLMSGGQYNYIPQIIYEIKSMIALVINDYQLKQINPGIEHLDSLEELSLSGNNLEEIPDFLFQLNQIKILDLSKNKLRKIPKKIGSIKNIRHLNLSQNSILKIPEEIIHLNRINSIDLSFNEIKLIPDIFKNNYLIQKINLSNNSITQVNPNLFQESLFHLNLSNNKIEKIPDSIQSSYKIKKLNLSKNPLQSIHQNITYLQQLYDLDLHQCPLPQFPIGLVGLDKLEQIRGWDARTRKTLLTFIKHAVKEKWDFSKREMFWRSYESESLDRPQYIQLLNSGFKPFMEKAKNALVSIPESLTNPKLYIAGRTKTQKSTIVEKLLSTGIEISKTPDFSCNTILLGNGRYAKDIPEDWKGIFVSESFIIEHYNITSSTIKKELSDSAIENVKRLLLSNESNRELGLQLLQEKQISESLLATIFFIMVVSEHNHHRQLARQIIKNNTRTDLLIYTKKEIHKEYYIYDLLQKIKSINKKELSYLFFNHNHKGWKFIQENYDPNILLEIKNSKSINLSYSRIKEIPPLIQNSPIKRIDLSNNLIHSISKKEIILLQSFIEINLSDNPIHDFDFELLSSPNLRRIYVKHCGFDSEEIRRKKAKWVTVFL